MPKMGGDTTTSRKIFIFIIASTSCIFVTNIENRFERTEQKKRTVLHVQNKPNILEQFVYPNILVLFSYERTDLSCSVVRSRTFLPLLPRTLLMH